MSNVQYDKTARRHTCQTFFFHSTASLGLINQPSRKPSVSSCGLDRGKRWTLNFFLERVADAEMDPVPALLVRSGVQLVSVVQA